MQEMPHNTHPAFPTWKKKWETGVVKTRGENSLDVPAKISGQRKKSSRRKHGFAFPVKKKAYKNGKPQFFYVEEISHAVFRGGGGKGRERV